jgi:ubiquinone/menaquinone biosynthesis C-methylase UbiE
MASAGREPTINRNKPLQRYYASLESRIGYRLMLGGTRHFGYYTKDTYWPFPIKRALRAMEDHLFNTLELEKGAHVLDAGCGVGHVAIHLAKKGLRVDGIDVVERHRERALRNVRVAKLENAVTLQKMDYHHLDGFTDETFDGVYTMETFAHATDPEAALAQFYRVVKPGGSLALYEYDHLSLDVMPPSAKKTVEQVTKYAALPAEAMFGYGVLEKFMAEAGFEDVIVRDLSTNIMPMMRLFCGVAFFPYLFVRLLGLQSRLVNTVASVECYRGRQYGRYIVVSARKPLESSDLTTNNNQEK